jgi:hypothetical protein
MSRRSFASRLTQFRNTWRVARSRAPTNGGGFVLLGTSQIACARTAMVWTTPVASIVSSTWKSTVVTASTEHQTSSADASAVCKAAPVMLRSAIPVDWCIPKSISGQCGAWMALATTAIRATISAACTTCCRAAPADIGARERARILHSLRESRRDATPSWYRRVGPKGLDLPRVRRWRRCYSADSTSQVQNSLAAEKLSHGRQTGASTYDSAAPPSSVGNPAPSGSRASTTRRCGRHFTAQQ